MFAKTIKITNKMIKMIKFSYKIELLIYYISIIYM